MSNYEKICAIITMALFVVTFIIASHFDWVVMMGK